MNCTTVDEMAAAYALGAVPAEEDLAISEHLATCDEPHVAARELIGVAAILPAGLEPVEPSSALRGRLMATIAATTQDHAIPAAAPRVEEPPRRVPVAEPRRPWWHPGSLPAAVAAVGLVAAIGLGAWNLTLSQQLAEREAALRAVATADAAHAVSGPAGSGWVLETDDGAIFLAGSLAPLPADRLYELWLIGPDAEPVAVGTLTDTAGIALVTLERGLGPATTFAVTVEAERVTAPTSDPVLVATLDG